MVNIFSRSIRIITRMSDIVKTICFFRDPDICPAGWYSFFIEFPNIWPAGWYSVFQEYPDICPAGWYSFFIEIPNIWPAGWYSVFIEYPDICPAGWYSVFIEFPDIRLAGSQAKPATYLRLLTYTWYFLILLPVLIKIYRSFFSDVVKRYFTGETGCVLPDGGGGQVAAEGQQPASSGSCLADTHPTSGIKAIFLGKFLLYCTGNSNQCFGAGTESGSGIPGSFGSRSSGIKKILNVKSSQSNFTFLKLKPLSVDLF